MKRSAISWTDFSGGDLNFVTGCTPVSAGCANCYARAIYERFGRDFSQVRTHPEKLERLRKKVFPQENNKRGPHSRPMCFVCDTGDLFHESVPAEFIVEAFHIMSCFRGVDWQVLTKRPERIGPVLFGEEGGHYLGGGDYHANIWLGVTVENQAQERRIDLLLRNWMGITWVSVEPMLESVDLRRWMHGYEFCTGWMEPQVRPTSKLDWIICGAESGPNRRPFDVAWAADLKAQCDDAGVAFFGKQGSGLHPGVRLAIDGRTWHAWPEVRR